MTANSRLVFVSRSGRTLVGALFVLATWGVGCLRPPDSSTSRAAPTPAAQRSDASPFTPADDATIDARAQATEAKMTDDERFTFLISLIGTVPSLGVPRDHRIPDSVANMSAGYTPGVQRLGIPALQSSDASMGVTNPGYRPDDKGATAFPASIVVGSSFNPRRTLPD